MQCDIQGDHTMTVKQTRLVTTDVAKLTLLRNGFFGTPQRLRSLGWRPRAAGLADTPFDSL